MKEAFASCFEIPGWCPQRKRGTLSSEEKQYFILFYFMKSVVGSLTLLDRNCRMVKRGSLKCISVHFTKINNIISSLLERLPNLTTKQKNNQWAHHCEKNVITKSWNFGFPAQHQQDLQVSIPQRLAVKSLPFPAPPVDLLRAQRIVFTLGSKIFFFTSFWPLVFTQLGSPIIFQKMNLISFGTKGMGSAWSELLFSDPGLGGSKVLFCTLVLDTIELFFWRSWVPSF